MRGRTNGIAYAGSMSGRMRIVVPALLAVIVAIAGTLLAGGIKIGPGPDATQTASGSGPGGSGLGGSSGATPDPTFPPTPTPRPSLGGTELFGYVPYWQMNDTVATYLQSAPLTTMALFSVTARKTGAIDTRPLGYRRITGAIGQLLITEAHARGARVELVFASFGGDRNGQLFGRLPIAPLCLNRPWPRSRRCW